MKILRYFILMNVMTVFESQFKFLITSYNDGYLEGLAKSKYLNIE